MLISKTSPQMLNNKVVNNISVRPLAVSFGSAPIVDNIPPKTKIFSSIENAYDSFTTEIAKGFGKALDNKFTIGLLKRLKTKNLFAHLVVLGSTILSGFYIKKTLDNDKLDPQKRKTLAINQAAVWGLSTVMAYTVDNLLNNKYEGFKDKFVAAHKNLKTFDAKELEIYTEGLKIAKTAIVMGAVYRFIAPVLVTPIANHIGNKIHEKKEARLAENN